MPSITIYSVWIPTGESNVGDPTRRNPTFYSEHSDRQLAYDTADRVSGIVEENYENCSPEYIEALKQADLKLKTSKP